MIIQRGNISRKNQLNFLELDLFNKGYKISKSPYPNRDDEIHTSVYKFGKLYCEIVDYYTTYELKVTYYQNNMKLKTVWYQNGLKTKSTSYYDDNGKIFINYGLVNVGSSERKYFKYNYHNNHTIKGEIYESDLSKFISQKVLDL